MIQQVPHISIFTLVTPYRLFPLTPPSVNGSKKDINCNFKVNNLKFKNGIDIFKKLTLETASTYVSLNTNYAEYIYKNPNQVKL